MTNKTPPEPESYDIWLTVEQPRLIGGPLPIESLHLAHSRSKDEIMELFELFQSVAFPITTYFGLDNPSAPGKLLPDMEDTDG